MATREERKIEEEEKKREREVRLFLISIAPLLLQVDNVASFNRIKNQINGSVDQFVQAFSQELFDSLFSEISRINPQLSVAQANQIVADQFSFLYKIKGTNQKISMFDIILRRGEEFKSSIANTYIQKYGFNEIGSSQLKELTTEVFQKNKFKFARIQTMELHKAQIDGASLRGQYLEENELLLGYQYTTAGDDRVRSSHAANEGFWSIERVNEEGRPETLDQFGCRCTWSPVSV